MADCKLIRSYLISQSLAIAFCGDSKAVFLDEVSVLTIVIVSIRAFWAFWY